MAISWITPVATVWWLRPVSSAARDGEHNAVVWNWLYSSPSAASRSAVGILTRPPFTLGQPNPTSSSRISRMFGAPSGASFGFGKSGVDSVAYVPIFAFP